MKKIYIISGCNGAGKTTASYTILPDLLDCKEFVNADEIAKGLSPFDPEKASIQAGKLMLKKVYQLLDKNHDFAFETTLAAKSHRNIIEKAQIKGYKTILLFFYLRTSDLAVKRVETRVKEGGHDIPENTIRRRYEGGLKNFFTIYRFLVNEWMFIDNSGNPYEIIGESNQTLTEIHNKKTWDKLQIKYGK
mgnify:FL=1